MYRSYKSATHTHAAHSVAHVAGPKLRRHVRETSSETGVSSITSMHSRIIFTRATSDVRNMRGVDDNKMLSQNNCPQFTVCCSEIRLNCISKAIRIRNDVNLL